MPITDENCVYRDKNANCENHQLCGNQTACVKKDMIGRSEL